MIVAAFVLLSLGWLLEYCGFTNTDPRAEIAAAFNGGHAPKGSQAQADFGSGSDAASTAGGTSVGRIRKQTRAMAMLPLHISTRPGIQVDKGIAPEVVRLCDTFHVRVSSGLSSLGHVSNSDHKCGGACDFVGTERNLKALYNYAVSAGYAYVEPWHDSTTVGVLGTTGKHVHISFFRCGGRTPGAN